MKKYLRPMLAALVLALLVGGAYAASAGDTNGTANALCELLPVKLGIGAAPVGRPQSTPAAPQSR